MENNKLEQLTQKLYEQGLSKGRSEGEKMLADARKKAAAIVDEARAEAEKIVKKAHAQAEDVRKNAMTEISLAGRQAVGRIKDEIAHAIVAKSVKDGVRQANMDPEFIKDMLLAVARNWEGACSGKIALKALLPEDRRQELDAAFEKSVGKLLDEGIEVGYSRETGSGFRVEAKNGGYYINFSDEDFDALLGIYLRDKVSKLLYEKQ